MRDSSENLVGVLFVLDLVYVGLLFLVFTRSYDKVCRRGNTSSYRRVFTGFYAMIWATLILTIGLYSSLTAHFYKLDTTIVSTVAFYFSPTILMVLSYVLLYFQLDLMMRKSKIQSSQGMVNKLSKTTRLAHAVRILVMALVTLFVLIQLLLMTLCFFEFVSLRAFLIELVVFMILLVLALNINQMVWYCKQSGQPYKSRNHYVCVRRVGMVCAIWSIAFLGKLAAFYSGYNLFILEIESVDVYQACVLGMTDFFTLVVPYYSVIDN